MLTKYYLVEGWRCFGSAVCVALVTMCMVGCSPSDQAESPPDFETTRDRALLRGLLWLEQYLDCEEHMLGMSEKLNAFRIFREFAYTSNNPEIREMAKRVTFKYSKRLKTFFSEVRNPESDHQLFVDMLEFVSERDMAGVDLTSLAERVSEIYATFRTDEEFFGVDLTDLNTLSEDAIFNLLMDLYALEKANLEYKGQFRCHIDMVDVLIFLKNRKLISFTGNRGAEEPSAVAHSYLATHLCYVLTNYGRLYLEESSFPVVIQYLRDNFRYVLADGDIELVGEFIDVFRSMGRTENDDPMIKAGTEFLIRTQNEDGSWGNSSDDDPYNAMHYTWCAVVGLRDRIFLKDTAYEKRIKHILAEVNK